MPLLEVVAATSVTGAQPTHATSWIVKRELWIPAIGFAMVVPSTAGVAAYSIPALILP